MSEPAATGSARPGVPRAVVSDDRLARRATKGDRRALAAIYRRYHQDLYRFCLAIVGNSQDAQDALQNTMVKVLGALPGEKREIRLKPWLYRIAHNESIEVVRRRRPAGRGSPRTRRCASGCGGCSPTWTSFPSASGRRC
jgi:DNA-directed RNA polymerase specialized sigma24 family protein